MQRQARREAGARGLRDQRPRDDLGGAPSWPGRGRGPRGACHARDSVLSCRVCDDNIGKCCLLGKKGDSVFQYCLLKGSGDRLRPHCSAHCPREDAAAQAPAGQVARKPGSQLPPSGPETPRPDLGSQPRVSVSSSCCTKH